MDKKKILVHMCCAPCSVYPVRQLEAENFDLMGYFYKDNIHPYSECLKRQESLKKYSESAGFRVIWQEGYDPERFLQNVVFREAERCTYCYHDRLKSTALMAKRGKFDYFTTTLLYSRFQNHEMICAIAQSLEKTSGVSFYYQDFRQGWKEGIAMSKAMDLYRQQYCGCIYSEKKRFFKEKKVSFSA